MDNIFKYNAYRYVFNSVLEELVKRTWTDFDYHRHNMIPIINMIKKLHWVDVDENVYSKLYCRRSDLDSRYSHYNLKKCYPSSNECHECFKYWCGICGYGSNSMYMSCINKRCMNFIEKIPEIFVIKSTQKHIYIFKYNRDFGGFEFGDKKHILRDKDTYKFYEIKDSKISSKELYKNKN